MRLRYAYLVTCREVVKDAAGEVVELRCTYDPATRGGDAPDGRRPKATLHWVSAAHAVPAEVRLYDHLFTRPDPGADGDLLADLNPKSEEVLAGCLVEPVLAGLPVGETVQFERLGYFCPDPDSKPGRPVFNRTLHPEGHLGQDPGQGPAGPVSRSVGLGTRGITGGGYEAVRCGLQRPRESPSPPASSTSMTSVSKRLVGSK